MSLAMRRFIFWCGVAMAVGGFLLAQWAIRHFSQFVNYQRVGVVLPLIYGATMMYVDTFASWSTASTYTRIKAAGILSCAVLVTIGALFWLLAAPDAQATP